MFDILPIWPLTRLLPCARMFDCCLFVLTPLHTHNICYGKHVFQSHLISVCSSFFIYSFDFLLCFPCSVAIDYHKPQQSSNHISPSDVYGKLGPHTRIAGRSLACNSVCLASRVQLVHFGCDVAGARKPLYKRLEWGTQRLLFKSLKLSAAAAKKKTSNSH